VEYTDGWACELDLNTFERSLRDPTPVPEPVPAPQVDFPRELSSSLGRNLLLMAFKDGPQAVTTATLTSIAELQNPIPYVASGFGVSERNPWARMMMRQTPMAVALCVGWGC
jgi:hypothetical protein